MGAWLKIEPMSQKVTPATQVVKSNSKAKAGLIAPRGLMEHRPGLFTEAGAESRPTNPDGPVPGQRNHKGAFELRVLGQSLRRRPSFSFTQAGQ